VELCFRNYHTNLLAEQLIPASAKSPAAEQECAPFNWLGDKLEDNASKIAFSDSHRHG